VTISENGPGIPDEERRVLEAGTETPLEHSSGLGLWFAYWLVHYVGGDITLDVDDGGTTVAVTLPVRHNPNGS
jgi:signal transduction histidine kinase